jgi:hypothetical protein
MMHKLTNDFVKQLKLNEDGQKTFELKVFGSEGQYLGKLRLIDKARVKDVSLASNLTRWRNASMRFFLSQFVATEARTQLWLETIVLPAKDRLLFELLDDSDRAIGHAGVCNLTESTAELDNFIRGESGGSPNLFVAAEITLIAWLFDQLNIEMVTLQIFSNNWIPINNHLSIGFSITSKHVLSRIEHEGGIQYLLDSDEGERVKFSCIKMCLSKRDFAKRKAA